MLDIILRKRIKWNRPEWMKQKPTRNQFMIGAILFQIVLVFILFFLFDKREIFKGDVVYKPYETLDIVRLQWGWFRKAFTFVFACGTLAWLIAIFNEYTAYHDIHRSFRKWYRD